MSALSFASNVCFWSLRTFTTICRTCFAPIKDTQPVCLQYITLPRPHVMPTTTRVSCVALCIRGGGVGYCPRVQIIYSLRLNNLSILFITINGLNVNRYIPYFALYFCLVSSKGPTQSSLF